MGLSPPPPHGRGPRRRREGYPAPAAPRLNVFENANPVVTGHGGVYLTMSASIAL
jgi:hypothetical protein